MVGVWYCRLVVVYGHRRSGRICSISGLVEEDVDMSTDFGRPYGLASDALANCVRSDAEPTRCFGHGHSRSMTLDIVRLGVVGGHLDRPVRSVLVGRNGDVDETSITTLRRGQRCCGQCSVKCASWLRESGGAGKK